MTFEEAKFFLLMLQSNFDNIFDEWLEKELLTQERLSDLVLELSLCSSDKNKTISVLNNYCSDKDIDMNLVFDLVWKELHNVYVNNLLSQEKLIDRMYMIYRAMDYNDIDCYWQTFDIIFECADLTKDGTITQESFDKMYYEFLMNKSPAIDNDPFTTSVDKKKTKSKNYRKLLVVLLIIFTLIVIGFSYLFFNGLSGIHLKNDYTDGQIKVACVGDSITYGHGVTPWHKNNYPAVLQELLGDDYNVQNFGVSGTTAQSTGDQPYIETDAYKESIEYNADILIFMLGSNDSKPENWTDAETFKKEYLELLDTYIAENDSPKIYLGIPAKAFYEDENQTEGITTYDIQPNIVEEIGDIVKEIANERGYKYIDIYELTSENSEWFAKDYVHPNSDGAEAIANQMYKNIK